MIGSAAWVTQRAPKRLVSIWSRACACADLLDRAEEPVAGVVDDDVEPAELLVGLLDRGEVGVVILDVERHRQHAVAVLLGQRRERRGVARRRRDLVAALERRLGPDAAEALRAPGDEPNLRICHPSSWGRCTGEPRSSQATELGPWCDHGVMRIASLVPSSTEMLFALGLGDETVGRHPRVRLPARGGGAPAADRDGRCRRG